MSTDQRDELAAIYVDTLNRGHGMIGRPEQGLRAADAILAAGYRKPRIITTMAELEALPAGAVVKDANELPSERFNNSIRSGWTYGYEVVTPQLPATLLWEPTAEVGE